MQYFSGIILLFSGNCANNGSSSHNSKNSYGRSVACRCVCGSFNDSGSSLYNCGSLLSGCFLDSRSSLFSGSFFNSFLCGCLLSRCSFLVSKAVFLAESIGGVCDVSHLSISLLKVNACYHAGLEGEAQTCVAESIDSVSSIYECELGVILVHADPSVGL